MIGTWPGFRKVTIPLILPITCLTVATEWAWCQRRGNRDVMLTSNGGLFFIEAWWADQVTFSSHALNCCDLLQPFVFMSQLLAQQSGFWINHTTMWRKWHLLYKEGRVIVGKGMGKFCCTTWGGALFITIKAAQKWRAENSQPEVLGADNFPRLLMIERAYK